ncbi:putative membrane protein [Paenibacillus phyllosphaerae]|uniref:Putative membrane protein n=1 Tax=Paenibacillus phyllosphaerae TaxID=274593 RepID=A0A7W5AY34_9BACL|nr:DUF4870 domain-containing protein [Paenibacillus phyllosphaerae]MBB3110900.1 putative membrane protein [Paenibacillus phyllosphaerae]
MQPYMPDRSSTGMDPRLVGLLCYFGLCITGVIFLVWEKQSRFVKFHALQSILVSIALMVINIVLGLLPIIGWIIGIFFAPFCVILWIAMMALAMRGRWFKLPLIGEYAERQSQLF